MYNISKCVYAHIINDILWILDLDFVFILIPIHNANQPSNRLAFS